MSSVVTSTGIVVGKLGSDVVVVDDVVVEVFLDVLPTPSIPATFFSSANCLDSIGVGSLLKITPAKQKQTKFKIESKFPNKNHILAAKIPIKTAPAKSDKHIAQQRYFLHFDLILLSFVT